MQIFLYTPREESTEESVLLTVFLDTDDLEYTEDTDHDESVLVPVVWRHERWYLSTEVGHEDHEHKYSDHQDATVGTSPVSKCWVIRLQILGLEYRKSSYNEYEEQCEDTRLWDTEYCWFCDFGEALLEHLERREEDDEESEPLDGWVFF